jgi:pyruvate,water dikinase
MPEDVPVIDWLDWQARFQAYLAAHGRIAYEFDFVNPTPAEAPELLLDTIKMFMAGQGSNPYERQRIAAQRREEATARVLKRVGWPRKGWFKKALGWAQRTVPVREDSLADMTMGHPIIRQMLNELGRRLVAGGAIQGAADIYWLEEAEVETLIAALGRGETLPDHSNRVPARRAQWQAQRRLNPPAMLPENSRWAKMLPWSKQNQEGQTIRGLGTSAGKITATARVLFGPEDFAQMRPGDVLVAVTTTPAWTPLFAMAAAVVTDIGGPLSHSSIVAREYGIPAVMATSAGTRRIRSGQIVTVDGSAGTVLLEEA